MIDEEKKLFINIVRGTAIFLMLWGHVIQYACGGQFDFFNNIMFRFIYSFHMPLFMFLSGFLFYVSASRREKSELLEYKCKSLLYPILMCSIINYSLTIGISSILKQDKSYMLCGASITELWFLWSVLSCSVLFSIVQMISSNLVTYVVLSFAFFPLVALFPNPQMNLFMYPYFMYGCIFALLEQRFVGTILWKWVKSIIYIVGTGGFLIMMPFYQKKHYIYVTGIFGGESLRDSIDIDLFRWVIGLCGCIAAILFIRIIYSVAKRIGNKGKAIPFIEKLGKDSLAIYVMSTVFLSYWFPIVMNKVLKLIMIDWNRYMFVYNMVLTPFVALLFSYLMIFIVELLKKWNLYRLIFGR